MSYESYLKQITQNSGYSPSDQALSDTLFGTNIIGRSAPIPLNTENHGYTFFTKPDLNLSYDNLQVDRVLSNLLMEAPNGIQRAIRSYLDPRGQTAGGLTCTTVDALSPFISLLGNNLVSISGWEELTLGTHSSEPGMYREVYGYVDDVPYQYGSYDLQCSFKNIIGDPITFMMRMWTQYQGLVYEGRLMPYPDNVLQHTIDYNTRIYRLVMDVSRTYVTRLFACGASFPISNNLATHADFDASSNNTPFNGVSENLSIVFKSYGFTNYDHILIYEFNELQTRYNVSMGDEQREQNMIKLKPWEREYFNYKSYPRINPMSMELEWWVPKQVYNDASEGVIRLNAPSTNTPTQP